VRTLAQEPRPRGQAQILVAQVLGRPREHGGGEVAVAQHLIGRDALADERGAEQHRHERSSVRGMARLVKKSAERSHCPERGVSPGAALFTAPRDPALAAVDG